VQAGDGGVEGDDLGHVGLANRTHPRGRRLRCLAHTSPTWGFPVHSTPPREKAGSALAPARKKANQIKSKAALHYQNGLADRF
jgi:hypothetical protein